MGTLRDVGWRIRELVNGKKKVRDNLCKFLNFSIIDYEKLCDGRLAVTPIQIRKIAEFFNITWDKLFYIQPKYDKYYGFSSKENCDEILNIMDSYIDIKEAALSE